MELETSLETNNRYYPSLEEKEQPPIPIIRRTSNYNMFKNIGNRKVVPRHVNELMDQMHKQGYFIPAQPIVVDSNFVIIDGQHRLIAAEKLGFPVCYVIEDSFNEKQDSMTSMNAFSSRWTPENFLDRQDFLGNPAYVQLSSFMNEYNLTASYGLQILKHGSGEKNVMKKFKAAELQISDVELARARVFASNLNEIRSFHPSYATFNYVKQFLAALLTMVLHPKYDHDHFIGNLYGREADIYKMYNSATYLLAFEGIFNKGRKNSKVVFKKIVK